MPTVAMYRYTDARGTVHVVQHLHQVPPRFRDGAAKVEQPLAVEPGPTVIDEVSQTVVVGALSTRALAKGAWSDALHVPSAGIGLAVGLASGWLVGNLIGRARWVVRGLVTAGGMALAVAIYLAAVRYAVPAGHRLEDDGAAGLATPGALVDEAREAASRAEQRMRQQDATIERLGR